MNEAFIACDWGTTNCRLWLVGSDGQVIRTVDHAMHGVARISAEFKPEDRPRAFAAALNLGLDNLKQQTGVDPGRLTVMISGMATSSIGWVELPYAPLPFALDGSQAVMHRWTERDGSPTMAGRIVFISGVRDAADMIRGEETEAVGAAARIGSETGRDAVLILPGTHSKHLRIGKGSITAIRTLMTGELFALLTTQSVLRHSIDPKAGPGTDRTAFTEGVQCGSTEGLARGLFAIRAGNVLSNRSTQDGSAFLNGLLLGDELSSLIPSKPPSCPDLVWLSGSPRLVASYRHALEILGVGNVRVLTPDPERPLCVMGQHRLWQTFVR